MTGDWVCVRDACLHCEDIKSCGWVEPDGLWSPSEPNPFGNPVIIEIRSDRQPQEDT